MSPPTCDDPRPADAAADVDNERARQLLAVAPMVRRICTARLGAVDGQDAAQDVMEAVWRAQHRPDFTDGPLFGYAATLARYRVARSYAARDRAPLSSGDLGELLWADPIPGPAEQVEHLDAERQVDQLLAALSPRQRQVMLASELGARSSVETAAELGMPASTVRTAQARAMARMRELVGARSPNPLASALPERERNRRANAARAVANGTAGRGPGGAGLPPELHQAGRAAAAAGWSTREMAARFRVSESTAWRWRTEVLHAGLIDDGPSIDRSADDVTTWGADPLPDARDAVDHLPALDHLDEEAAAHERAVTDAVIEDITTAEAAAEDAGDDAVAGVS